MGDAQLGCASDLAAENATCKKSRALRKMVTVIENKLGQFRRWPNLPGLEPLDADAKLRSEFPQNSDRRLSRATFDTADVRNRDTRLSKIRLRQPKLSTTRAKAIAYRLVPCSCRSQEPRNVRCWRANSRKHVAGVRLARNDSGCCSSRLRCVTSACVATTDARWIAARQRSAAALALSFRAVIFQLAGVMAVTAAPAATRRSRASVSEEEV